MAKRRTNEEFLEIFKNKNNFSDNIIFLTEYVSSNTKILCKCKIDENEWYAKPKDLVQGSGCKICGRLRMKNSKLKTNEKFLSELSKISKNIIPLTEFTGVNNKMKFRCAICGYEWETFASGVLGGNKCKNCSNLKMSKTNEFFLNELHMINPMIKPIEKYVNSFTPILFQCKTCNAEFKTSPHNILKNGICPKCIGSNMELKINNLLKFYNIDFNREQKFANCKYVNDLRFDFYLPIFNICIEYDGEQHYSTVNFGGISNELALENFKKN